MIPQLGYILFCKYSVKAADIIRIRDNIPAVIDKSFRLQDFFQGIFICQFRYFVQCHYIIDFLHKIRTHAFLVRIDMGGQFPFQFNGVSKTFQCILPVHAKAVHHIQKKIPVEIMKQCPVFILLLIIGGITHNKIRGKNQYIIGIRI